MQVLALSFCLLTAGSNAWTRVPGLPDDVHGFLVDPANAAVIYAASSGSGLFKSSDSGVTFAVVPGTESGVAALVIDPVERLLYLGMNGGVSVSSVIDSPPLSFTSIGAPGSKGLAIARPAGAPVVFAAPNGLMHRGVRSGGIGGAWTFTMMLLGDGIVTSAACDVASADCFIAMEHVQQNDIWFNDNASADPAQWSLVSDDPTNQQGIATGTGLHHRMFTQPVGAAFDLFVLALRTIWFTPPYDWGGTYQRRVTSGTPAAAFTSWSVPDMWRPRDIAFDGALPTPDRVFVCGDRIASNVDGRMYKSEGGWDAFTPRQSGLPSYTSVNACMVAPMTKRVFAATTSGVFSLDEKPFSLTALSPATAYTYGNSTLTITGEGFAPNMQVWIGGDPVVSVDVQSDTTAVIEVAPQTDLDPVDIDVSVEEVGDETLSAAVTFVAPPPPSITSVAPSSGGASGGVDFTITGGNFLSFAVVRFGAVPAIIVARNGGEISGRTPPLQPGVYDVTVFNPDGQSTTLMGIYTAVAAPALSAVDPKTGSTAGDEWVTVTGAGFVDGIVLELGKDAPLEVVVDSPTQLRLRTPPHAPGIVPLRAVNPDGQRAGLGAAFSYLTPPPLVPELSAEQTSGPGMDETRTGDLAVGAVDKGAGVPLCASSDSPWWLLAVMVIVLRRARRC